MSTCPNCGLWEGAHHTGEYCRCNEPTEQIEHPESSCGKPCEPSNACDECADYWHRMRSEGFWIGGQGWTNKAMKEMCK